MSIIFQYKLLSIINFVIILTSILSISLVVPSAFGAGRILKSDDVYVIDGDTIVISNIRIRLHGIRVLELNTAEGRNAKSFLARFVKNKLTYCSLLGQKSYNREIAICYADKRDLAAVIVENGHGSDCPKYSHGKYASLEREITLKWVLPTYCVSC